MRRRPCASRSARHAARDHDRVCDNLDEIGDRYNDARDAFDECGEGVVAIDLRGELRQLLIAKKINRCDDDTPHSLNSCARAQRDRSFSNIQTQRTA